MANPNLSALSLSMTVCVVYDLFPSHFLESYVPYVLPVNIVSPGESGPLVGELVGSGEILSCAALLGEPNIDDDDEGGGFTMSGEGATGSWTTAGWGGTS